MLSVDCVFTDVMAASDKEIISLLADKLTQKGLVKESYKSAILEREEIFPTGLLTKEIGIAIPHTDSIHVLEASFGVAKLKESVSFAKMGGAPDERVEVEIVIMMGISDETKQVPTIAKILDMFADEEAVGKIKRAKAPEELYSVFHEYAGL